MTIAEAGDPEEAPEREAPTWGAFEGFLGKRLLPPDDVLDEVLEANRSAGLPEISVSANQGSLLAMLVLISGARRVLELGTHGGYSAIWMARALPAGGTVLTVEAEESRVEMARANFRRAGLEDLIETRVGLAEEVVTTLAAAELAPFDLVFIDVDEELNAKLFAPATRLVRRNGVVVVGAADLVRGTRQLFAALAREPAVSATAVQAVGSGGFGGFVIAVVTGSSDLDGGDFRRS